jgi:hypothetical protein
LKKDIEEEIERSRRIRTGEVTLWLQEELRMDVYNSGQSIFGNAVLDQDAI